MRTEEAARKGGLLVHRDRNAVSPRPGDRRAPQCFPFLLEQLLHHSPLRRSCDDPGPATGHSTRYLVSCRAMNSNCRQGSIVFALKVTGTCDRAFESLLVSKKGRFSSCRRSFEVPVTCSRRIIIHLVIPVFQPDSGPAAHAVPATWCPRPRIAACVEPFAQSRSNEVDGCHGNLVDTGSGIRTWGSSAFRRPLWCQATVSTVSVDCLDRTHLGDLTS